MSNSKWLTLTLSVVLALTARGVEARQGDRAESAGGGGKTVGSGDSDDEVKRLERQAAEIAKKLEAARQKRSRPGVRRFKAVTIERLCTIAVARKEARDKVNQERGARGESVPKHEQQDEFAEICLQAIEPKSSLTIFEDGSFMLPERKPPSVTERDPYLLPP